MRATSERYRDGSQTLLQLRNRCWGPYETAELRDKDDRDRFLDTYYVPNSAELGTRVAQVVANSSPVYERLTQNPSASRAASRSSSSARVSAAGNRTP